MSQEPDGQAVSAPVRPRSMRDRTLAGDAYRADDPELVQALAQAHRLTHRINSHDPSDREGLDELLGRLLGRLGEHTEIRPPIYVDYGAHTFFGDRCFVNFGLVVLDVRPVTIGNAVLIGPNAQLLTAVHPVEPGRRRDKWESALPVTIGDNVWLGGGVIVCPGVTIGPNTVVGAGSVVVRDLPANVVAVGNPARVVRQLHVG